MRSLTDIAKDIRKWYDECEHDLLDPNELDELCTYLEQAEENERLATLFEEEQHEEYIDPSEYGGCSGHYADENMYMRGDHYEEE